MEINLTTPALLFPAISLLLLAYTNRFLTLASLIRDFHAKYKINPEDVLHGQIANLWYRVRLIKYMQAFGVSSILLCTVSMLALLADWQSGGTALFGLSLVLMAISLGLSLREILVSVDALDIRLRDMEGFTGQSRNAKK